LVAQNRCRYGKHQGADLAFSDNSRGIMFMMIAMTTFTLNDTFMKAVTQDVPLSQAIAVRGSLTAIALLILARIMGVTQWLPEPADRKLMVWRTFGEVAGTVTFLLALTHMPLANISAILQALPLAVTLGAAVLLGERVGWRRMTAICVGFFGVLLIVRPGTDGFNVCAVLALISVAFVVVRDLSTRRLSAGLPSVVIALYSAVAVSLMGYSGLALEPWVALDQAHFLLLCGASAMLILGYLFIVKAMRVGDIAIVAPFRYSSLIAALVLGWAVFGDFPSGLTLLGAAIVVATGLYTYLREQKVQRAIAATPSSMTGTATPDR
jgi:drug/metabolite transporter (DMT)-like permease